MSTSNSSDLIMRSDVHLLPRLPTTWLRVCPAKAKVALPHDLFDSVTAHLHKPGSPARHLVELLLDERRVDHDPSQLERLVNARDYVLSGALQVVTTAQDLVPDTAGCSLPPPKQWVDHSLPPLGGRGVQWQQFFCHGGGAWRLDGGIS